MSIFSEVKEHLTARQAAEYYGLKVKKNGTACCPFHDDRHPSMKIDKNYHCFACGAGGDAVDYVSRMFGLSQHDAALKLIEDFVLPVDEKRSAELNVQEKERIRREKAERERITHIRECFDKWCNQTIDILKSCISEIDSVNHFLIGKPPDIIFSEDYAQMLHAEPVINYWLDILCMGDVSKKRDFFLKDRKKVEEIAGKVCTGRKRIMGCSRGSA
ncbi:MAG: CHC2 zinc finger domain-containing protein [Lachnospiraceae bacterium]|nr:CHC2 zinc finger domain-containing protein [Lachnospiraceae bacterium]